LSYNVTEFDFGEILLIRKNTLYSYLYIYSFDEEVDLLNTYTLGIDIGSTTVKIAILDENEKLLFADYERHFANIQETLADLLEKEALEAWDERKRKARVMGETAATKLLVPMIMMLAVVMAIIMIPAFLSFYG
jgi:activator of 2-hydroxyglutaryl-CoA dehydratase